MPFNSRRVFLEGAIPPYQEPVCQSAAYHWHYRKLIAADHDASPSAKAGLQSPILVNRGWVPHGWRDKYLPDHHDLGELSEYKDASKKTDEKGPWWKFWSKGLESSPKFPAQGVPRHSKYLEQRCVHDRCSLLARLPD